MAELVLFGGVTGFFPGIEAALHVVEGAGDADGGGEFRCEGGADATGAVEDDGLLLGRSSTAVMLMMSLTEMRVAPSM